MAYSIVAYAPPIRKAFMTKMRAKKADLVAIGRRIRELRGKVLQDDFAPALGMTQGQLSKIERGMQAPSIDLLLRLRERGGRSVDWVLTGEERKGRSCWISRMRQNSGA